ncbi:hypothetical protein AgCh_002424 [Apium graveolens]
MELLDPLDAQVFIKTRTRKPGCEYKKNPDVLNFRIVLKNSTPNPSNACLQELAKKIRHDVVEEVKKKVNRKLFDKVAKVKMVQDNHLKFLPFILILGVSSRQALLERKTKKAEKKLALERAAAGTCHGEDANTRAAVHSPPHSLTPSLELTTGNRLAASDNSPDPRKRGRAHNGDVIETYVLK